MAYGEAARARRRCTGTRRDGARCEGWALWDDPRQLCFAHAGGAAKRGPRPAPPCRCPAYAWPHRPASGVCRWPELPEYRCLTPAGRHRGDYVRPDTPYGRMLRTLRRIYARPGRREVG